MSFRNLLARRIRSSPTKPLILMYHRIAVEPTDPWGLAVAPSRFEGHLRVLKRTRRPIPLREFARDLVSGTLPANAVAVTFDDGYADNLLAAKPCLSRACVPATVFLATGFLERPGEFWWDELARLLLREVGPPSIKLLIRGRMMDFDIGRAPSLQDIETWHAWSSPLTTRQAAFVTIWDTLRHLEEKEREALMSDIRATFSRQESGAISGRAMTHAEASALASDGLVSIGAHTVTHPLLTKLPFAKCLDEIAKSKATCEALTGQQVAAFAYPFGDLNAEVRAAVAATGFACGCSTENRPTTLGSDVLALPRIQVLNWEGGEFEQALRLASAGEKA